MNDEKSPFTPLYQLSLDVERLARHLRERNKKDWRPLITHVDELYVISTKLKLLDKNPKARFDDLG
jgi:hypothetical protein